MRLITFKNLEGKNFLSFGDNLVKINLQQGVNVITGVNFDKEDSKNGVGKSTITELLYFSLYGTTLREISKDFIQNSITKKKCEVSLTFELTNNDKTDIYKITRELNPTKCYLFKNGEDVTRSTLAKTNNFIQELIRTPSTVFQNSVIMSANNAVPFMALSKTDKRKFVESVLGLEVFGSMVLKARDEYNATKKDYEVEYSKYEQVEADLVFNSKQLENYELNKKETTSKLTLKMQTLAGDIATLEQKISQVEIPSAEEINAKINTLKQEEQEFNTKIQELHSKLIKITAEIKNENKLRDQLLNDKESCPTCKREYSEEHITHVTSLLSKHDNTISLYKEAENKVTKVLDNNKNLLLTKRTELKALEESKSASIALANEQNIQKNSLLHLQQNLQNIQKEIESNEQEQNDSLKERVATLTKSIEALKVKTEELNGHLNILEAVKFVISEEGIKSFIVKKVIKVLNSRLAYYLKKLEANCLCKFDEYFEEHIVDENSEQKSYFNFSGGERKRIDLACLFAFADVRRMQGDVNFSTIFYDELLDSSLDDKGVSLTLKVLRERFNEANESCYIITHRGPEVLTKAEHVIKLIKKNGITTLAN